MRRIPAMTSDTNYEHYYSEFYKLNDTKSYHVTPLFKAPEVVDENEERIRRQTVKSLKSQCIDRITSYNQVCPKLYALVAVDRQTNPLSSSGSTSTTG